MEVKTATFGWRLFGMAILLMLPYFAYTIYLFATYYISLAFPQVREVRPTLPAHVELTLYALFWLGVALVPIAVAIILISALFELKLHYMHYKNTLCTSRKEVKQ